MSLLRHARWLAGAALVAPAALAAQGFGLNEIGTCAVSRGFAVTSAPCADPSSIYWNPAAAAELQGNTLAVGASGIALKGGFTQDLSNRRYPATVTPALAPDVFFSHRVGPFGVGVGVYVPYGLTSQWGGSFPGRFSAQKASLQSIYIQPNVALNLNQNWAIGAGPILGNSRVTLLQSLDLSQQVAAVQNGTPITFGQLGIASQTEFARANVTGTAWAGGYNVGIHGHYANWQLGARYLSALTFNYNNARANFSQVATGLTLPVNNPISPASAAPLDYVLSAQFTGSGALTHQGARTTIVHPWQAQGGIAYTGMPGTTVSADVARIGWSKFNQLPVSFTGPAQGSNRVLIEDYQDSWAYRFGAEHTVQSTGLLHGVSGRIGYSYAQTAAPDVTVTPLLPDMDRSNFGFGFGVPVTNRYHVDLGYLHVYTAGRRGRIVERTSESQTAQQLNSGVYDLAANVFSLSLNANF